MFSKYGKYEAVGLFSTTHLISIVVLFFAMLLAVFLTKKMSRKCYLIVLRVFAIVFTCLELFKIGWTWWCLNNFILDAWLPLFFCSLFIYSLWLTWFKQKKIQDLGLSFIGIGCIIGGIAFIIFPTTSFRWFPIWHFQCLYSMIYHSAMVYAGIMCIVTKSINVNVKTVLRYCLFTFVFMALATGINLICNSNLMFTNNPGAIPLELLHIIYNFNPYLYSLIILISHTVALGFTMLGVIKLIEKIIKNKQIKKTK